MDRNLIISDNLSAFSPNSAALLQASKLQHVSDVQLVELKSDCAINGQTNGTEVRELEYESVSLKSGHRFDFGFALKLRKVVAGFRPTTIHLFCDRPQKLLSFLSFCGSADFRVHIAHRWPSVSLTSRLINPLVHGPRIKWSVTCREIAQDLIHEGINPDNIIVKRVQFPVDNFDVLRLHHPDEIRSRFNGRAAYPGDVHLISTVAPLKEKAGLRDLIWASELLKAVRDDLQIVIIGDNRNDEHEFEDGQHLSQLKRFIEATDLYDHVHFVGWSESAAEIIAASHVYCEPSAWTPNSIPLQFARQRGVPTAVVESPFNLRNFSHGDDCLMFPAGEKNEIGRRIRRLLDDNQLARQIAAQASSRKNELVAA